MFNLLISIAQLLDMSFNELVGLDSATGYRTLTKLLRKLLNRLHPDSGGDEKQFEEAHLLYEELLNVRKNDADNTGLSAALRVIASTASELGINNKSLESLLDLIKNKHIGTTFDDVINSSGTILIPRSNAFIINISELVLHYNSLKYCDINILPNPGPGRVRVSLMLTATDDTNKHEEASFDLWADYKQDGKYTVYTTLNCDYGEEITVQALGFDEQHTFKTTEAQLKTIMFRQNYIELCINLKIYI